jgi:hypothetical protein
MSASTVMCHVLNRNVSVVSNLEGKITNVICPEYERVTHACKLKHNVSGFFGNVMKGLTDRLIGTREKYCEFSEPVDLKDLAGNIGK